MKGQIFVILEHFIVDNYGRDAYEKFFEKVHTQLVTKEPFVGPGTYPDQDMLTLVGAVVNDFGIKLEDALEGFGRYAFSHLASGIPDIMSKFKDPLELLMSLESIVHTEVRKFYRDSSPPSFSAVRHSKGRITLTYKSGRQLFPLVIGLVRGCGDYFNRSLECTMQESGEGWATFNVFETEALQ